MGGIRVRWGRCSGIVLEGREGEREGGEEIESRKMGRKGERGR